MKKFEQFLKLFPICSFGVFLGHAVIVRNGTLAAFLTFLAITIICQTVLFILHRKEKRK